MDPITAVIPGCFGASAIAVVALMCVVYYYLVLPMDFTRDIDGVGYDFPNRHLDGKTRAAMVRDAIRKRKTGRLLPVYPNGWFGIIESCRLGPGEVRLVNALGQNLAVFRSESGEAHVLDAYCPHMGANMAVGGRVKGDCLECPFHEWQFSGHDGKCVAIPYAQKVPDFAKVRRWDSREVNGSVFIWHHAEGDPPSWIVEPIAVIEDKSWTYVGRNEFNVTSHIQDIPENAADPPHLEAIHAPGMFVASLSRHVWKAEWFPDQTETHIAHLGLNHEIALSSRMSLFKILVRGDQIGPAYVVLNVQTSIGPIVIVQTVLPLEPLLQRVIHRMYCPWWIVPYARFIMLGESIMFARDIAVWNHKQYMDKPVLVKEDRYIVRFRRWYSQFFTDNSPRFQRETLDW